jgi:protein TonB
MSSVAPPGSRARISTRPPPRVGVVVASRDPLDRVLTLGRAAWRGIALGVVFTLIAHGTAAARAALIPLELIHWNMKVGGRIKERLWASYDIDVVRAPPPKVEETKPEPEEHKPPPAPPPPKAQDKEPEPPPPAAAAQAGKALAMDQDPNEPVDMTNTIVQGAGSTYAGGTTAAAGTSTVAVRDPNAKPGGTPGGSGTGPVVAPQGPDKTRTAGLLGSTEWNDCPFPQEADAEQIDEAQVTIQVHVKPNGRAEKVVVLSDPGHGFGREARLCAMRKSFQIALDREGTPIAGVTKPFRVRFER